MDAPARKSLWSGGRTQPSDGHPPSLWKVWPKAVGMRLATKAVPTALNAAFEDMLWCFCAFKRLQGEEFEAGRVEEQSAGLVQALRGTRGNTVDSESVQRPTKGSVPIAKSHGVIFHYRATDRLPALLYRMQ